VLLYSTAGSVIWEVGGARPKRTRLSRAKRGILDHGAYYAQKTQLDSHGNRILWGWIPENGRKRNFSAQAGPVCMALPGSYPLALKTISKCARSDREFTAAPKSFLFSAQHAGLSERTATLKAIHFDNVCGELAWENKRGYLNDCRSGPRRNLGGRFMSSPKALLVS